MKCKYCGAEIPEWLDFCPECTKAVEPEQPAEETAPLPESEPEAAPEAVSDAAPETAPEAAQSAEQAEAPEQETAPVKEKKKTRRKKDAEPEAEVYQSPERPRRSRRKKKARGGASPFLWFLSGLLFCIALVAALMLAGVLQRGPAVSAAGTDADAQIVREQGFDSPEAVLQTYANALKEGDLRGMLSTYSGSAYFSHVKPGSDYDADFENGNTLTIWSPGQAELDVAGTGLSSAVAAEKGRSYLVDTIVNQFSYPLFHNNSFYTYDEDSGQSLILLKSEDDLQAYFDQLPDAKPFSEVTLGNVFEVSDKLSKKAAATYRDYMKTVASNCSAEAAAFYYIELTIDGEDYLLGMELVKYDGLWYNNQPYNYGVNFKNEYAYNNFGGLIPVDAIYEWQ